MEITLFGEYSLNQPFMWVVGVMLTTGTAYISFQIVIFVIKQVYKSLLLFRNSILNMFQSDYTVYKNTKDYKLVQSWIRKGKI